MTLSVEDFIGKEIAGYRIGNLLFQGMTNSLVFHADSLDGSRGKSVFRWIIPKKPESEIKMEIDVNKCIDTVPNAAVARDYVEYEGSLGFFMDYFDGGDLFERVTAGSPLSEDDARIILWDLVQCLKGMHGIGFGHFDVKLENILLTTREGVLRGYLTDFGLSTEIADGGFLTGRVGTQPYYAPEIILRRPFNKTVDIWALGVSFYAMITNNMPFGHWERDPVTYFHNAVAALYDREPLDYCEISDHAQDLIAGMLKQAWEERITIEQIERHEFFQAYIRDGY
jgi:serine/threonine protein kinase